MTLNSVTLKDCGFDQQWEMAADFTGCLKTRPETPMIHVALIFACWVWWQWHPRNPESSQITTGTCSIGRLDFLWPRFHIPPCITSPASSFRDGSTSGPGWINGAGSAGFIVGLSSLLLLTYTHFRASEKPQVNQVFRYSLMISKDCSFRCHNLRLKTWAWWLFHYVSLA